MEMFTYFLLTCLNPIFPNVKHRQAFVILYLSSYQIKETFDTTRRTKKISQY